MDATIHFGETLDASLIPFVFQMGIASKWTTTQNTEVHTLKGTLKGV